jgi:hypothetical protein
MLKTALIAALLLLTGCATTLEQAKDTEPHKFASKNGPQEAVTCIARQAEAFSGVFFGRVEPSGQTGGWRGIVRHNESGVSVVAEAMPTSQGSSITLWLSRQHFMLRDMLIKKITAGC